nr:uncharacterized protein LOC128688801 [Cherax quadricarinatus]
MYKTAENKNEYPQVEEKALVILTQFSTSSLRELESVQLVEEEMKVKDLFSVIRARNNLDNEVIDKRSSLSSKNRYDRALEARRERQNPVAVSEGGPDGLQHSAMSRSRQAGQYELRNNNDTFADTAEEVEEINAGGRGGVQVVTDKHAGTSWLLVTHATWRDAGNYTCAPAHATPATVSVHVLDEEVPAGLHHDLHPSKAPPATTATTPPPVAASLTLTLLALQQALPDNHNQLRRFCFLLGMCTLLNLVVVAASAAAAVCKTTQDLETFNIAQCL